MNKADSILKIANIFYLLVNASLDPSEVLPPIQMISKNPDPTTRSIWQEQKEKIKTDPEALEKKRLWDQYRAEYKKTMRELNPELRKQQSAREAELKREKLKKRRFASIIIKIKNAIS